MTQRRRLGEKSVSKSTPFRLIIPLVHAESERAWAFKSRALVRARKRRAAWISFVGDVYEFFTRAHYRSQLESAHGAFYDPAWLEWVCRFGRTTRQQRVACQLDALDTSLVPDCVWHDLQPNVVWSSSAAFSSWRYSISITSQTLYLVRRDLLGWVP